MEPTQNSCVPRPHSVTSLVLLCEPELFQHVLTSLCNIEGINCVLDDAELNHSVIVAEAPITYKPAQLVKLIQAVAGVLSVTVVVHHSASNAVFADDKALH